MFEKILDAWYAFGTVTANKYVNLSVRWLTIVLLPVYLVFTLLYSVGTILLVLAYMIRCKIEGSLTFTEGFDAFIEGIVGRAKELRG